MQLSLYPQTYTKEILKNKLQKLQDFYVSSVNLKTRERIGHSQSKQWLDAVFNIQSKIKMIRELNLK